MELLRKFKENGYFTSEIYHLLTKKKLVPESEEIIPSEYLKEMQLSSAERLQRLNNIQIDNIIQPPTGKTITPVLAFTPRVIVFQNFKPNDKIIAKFSVTNISTAPTFLNMIFKESSIFFIKPCGAQLLSRLAPGISYSFLVSFMPIQYEDYTHRVLFQTDTAQYALPLIAVGPRPIFDFPDQIVIPKTPLKIENCVEIAVHNKGCRDATFTLRSRSPFSCGPKVNFVRAGEDVKVKFYFKTMYLGSIEGVILALFETGEVFRINIKGEAHGVSIELEKETVRFLDTFNTMVRQQTFKITNKSDYVLSYVCMKNENVVEDFGEKVALARMFYDVKDTESFKCNKLVQFEVLSCNEHERVYTRIFADQIQALVVEESMHYQNMHFSIVPVKGKIWPNKVTEITIVFAPKEVGEFVSTCYLDIDGISQRVPLKMVGTSTPPLIQLNMETMDMDKVYINKTYNYEIVAVNRGHINGVIVYKERPVLFGSSISCTPAFQCLAPGDKAMFILSFSNPNQGPYFEEVNFNIRDTDVIIKLYLKGEVIYPTICFSKPSLDFGTVSVGMPTTLELGVINESDVNVTGTMYISSDGPEISSMTLDDCEAAELRITAPPVCTKEFNIDPWKLYIEPNSKIVVKVTLTANIPRQNKTSLGLEMDKSDSPPIKLPVSFEAVVPTITPAPDLNLRALFLEYVYKHDIIISSNEFWGYYSIEELEDTALQVNVEAKRGIIAPNSSLVLPATIRTSTLGPQEYHVRMHLFGLPEPLEICLVKGCGVRPIVTCVPAVVQFGHVKLLGVAKRTVTMMNDSPVKVAYQAYIFNNDDKWEITPSEGYIEPESEIELTISVYLVDAGSYSNKAIIHLEKIKDILVPVSAVGVGTSIVVGELRDKINLGRHFARIPMECRVTMENFGTKLHTLEWTDTYKSNKNKPVNIPFFDLQPRVFKLAAAERMDLVITGISQKVCFVHESWYLAGNVEGANKKELLLECPISAEFVEPKIEVSATLLHFRYDYGPYSEFYKLTDLLTIKNVSKLPLLIDMNVKQPFAIVQAKEHYRIPSQDEELCCCITCDEIDENIRRSSGDAEYQPSHTYVDCFTTKPVPPLRREPLNFFQDINKIKKHFQLTHTIEQRLEDEEVMKLQIVFDTTKHPSLKCKMYSDIVRIRFRGHKNKDAVKLVGYVNFPNIFLYTPKVDFHCALNETVQSKTIKVINHTPLLVCYSFQWKKCTITKVKVPEIHKMEPPTSEISSVIYQSKEPIQAEISAPGLGEELSVEGEEEVHEASKEISKVVLAADSERSEVENFKIRKLNILKKILPMLNVEYSPLNPWLNKFERKTKRDIDINDIFMIMPHRGLLKPKDTQYIQVIFSAHRNINVKAILECGVLGGPSEYITITGQSSELMYSVNTHNINFKIRSFHEKAKESLIITNIAQLPFIYKTYLNEPKFDNDLPAKIVDLVPSEKTLEPEEEFALEVVVQPGVVGYFHRTFLLEIGYYPAMPIEVFGWGVIPQVYLKLPRPQLSELPPVLGYLAIPYLTLNYLAAIHEIFYEGSLEHLNSPEVDQCMEDSLFDEEWCICSTCDEYPSLMDIELAIERMLVINHIKSRPDIINMYSGSSKTCPIPGFITTPYEVDFGVVITGSTVQHTAEVINYGPIATRLHFVKNYVPCPWLIIKLCGKLEPGDSGKIDITFCPSPNDFVDLEQDLDTVFYLEVSYGVVIPVRVKALCAVPYLKTNTSVIDLGSVRCGDKIICAIPIKNVGKPTCIWYATLKVKTSGPNPIEILDTSGNYEPEQGGWLRVSFKPTIEMTYEAVVIFRFHMNPNKLIIPIVGQGLTPQVHIIGPKINFPPTLPWAETTDMYFGITNPCTFPIQIIIAHVDDKWKEEEETLMLLEKYYNKPSELLVPIIKPGDSLPQMVQDFNTTFKSNVKKALDAEAAAALASVKIASARGKAVPQKGKSPKAKALTEKKEDKPEKRKVRTENEIIADEIRSMKQEGLDPLMQLDNIAYPKPKSTKSRQAKGLMVFLYGTPCDEMMYRETAYTLGKKMELPTINVDNMFVDALINCNCFAKNIILGGLNDAYESLKKAVNKEDTEPEEKDVEKDLFYTIQKKIEFLAVTKNTVTPRSKASERKKAQTSSAGSAAALPVMGSTTMFNMDYTLELLTDYLRQRSFSRGFVVETLDSKVIKPPSLVLTTLIRSKPNIKNLHLILYQSDLAKWIQDYEQKQREEEEEELNRQPKEYDEKTIAQIVQNFEEYDHDEYQKADPELRQIYIDHGLQHRKLKFLEKKLRVTATQRRRDDEFPHSKKEKSLKDVGSIPNPAPMLSESKRKLKKDDTNKKAALVKGKVYDDEVLAISQKYVDYMKNDYESLILIAHNWVVEDCEIAPRLYGLNGQLASMPAKKAKKKSEMQMHAVSETVIPDNGFPLTILYGTKSLDYKDGLINFFQTTPYIYKCLEKTPAVDILTYPMSRKEYTVLLPKNMPTITYEKPLDWFLLDEKPLPKCECCQINDLHLVDDGNQDNLLNILSKWHCVCGKKMASSQTSTSMIPVASTVDRSSGDIGEEDMYQLPLRAVACVPVHGQRFVLQPGDLVRCKYSFTPKDEGNFSVKRYIEAAGWPDSRVEITVNAISDLPRLDNRPKKMFANFVRRRLEDVVYKMTYLDDLKMFEFGPIFIGRQRIYEEEYTIDLRNASLMVADIEIEFLEEVDEFRIDKTFLHLEPGARDKVTISAAPAHVGVHTAVLLFCIKDNPEIARITIGCSGVVPNVEILPLTKNIDYHKLLLYRREDDRFIIKNDSILPIMWKVRNANEFLEDFIISQTWGIIPRNDNRVVPVTYIACNVGIINRKQMIIDIYDELGRGEPMIVDVLHLSAECYDVMVECAYENMNESFLNYGNVKVNSTVYKEMYLLNRGKYPIYYKLKKVKKFPEPQLLKSFEADEECGLLPPILKLVAVSFSCIPKTSMHLNNVPAYICSLLDGSKEQVVVAKFPVCVTIASFYNTFTLFPLGELNFHINAVGSNVTREVILNNTSKCPFMYDIIVPEKYRVDHELPTAHTPSHKGGKDKLKIPPIQCGNFLILNEDNLLAPGTSRTIQIQFNATDAKQFEEEINFKVSDTCPAESQGVPLRLVGTGAMPTLDFWNLANTFREHLIVKNIHDYKNIEPSPHCVFAEDTVTLHFYGVTIGSSNTAAIDLYNNGLVPCALTNKLHYQGNTSEEIFSLDKYEAHVEPLLHKNLGIIFSPKCLEEYRAVLEIKLRLLHNEERSFKICLIGVGMIPRIKLVQPNLKQAKLGVAAFPMTCLGSVSHKEIKFKNISSVNAVVKITVNQKQDERRVFYIRIAQDCQHMANKTGTTGTLQVMLNPAEVATITVSFDPLYRGRSSCDLQFSIKQNPYEYFMILCEAEGFMEDIILLGLEMLSLEADIDDGESVDKKKPKSAPLADRKKSKEAQKKKKASRTSIKSASESAFLRYTLDFGGCEMGAMYRRTVIMVNNSEKVFKFAWEIKDENIVIKPLLGFIAPGEEKDLEVAFCSLKPAVIKREALTCFLSAVSDDSLVLDLKCTTWDSRQFVTKFNHNPDLSLEERQISPLEQKKGFHSLEDLYGSNTIHILYSATTEYTKFASTLDENKSLRDTFIYQTRTFEFLVDNIGNVPMKIAWSFKIGEEYPARNDKYFKAVERKSTLPNEDEATAKAIPEIVQDSSGRNHSGTSKETLFSESEGRESVDTWFEADLPFTIEPVQACLKPHETCKFKVTFHPLEAFDYKVQLKSEIDNMDPYDQGITCNLSAKALVPYVHLDIPDSDYIEKRRKATGTLPPQTTVLEFNVLGNGCYKKTFNVLNPMSEGYEFVLDLVSDKGELIPFHCNMLKGFVEGGTSTAVTMTFAPTRPGTYESQWSFIISKFNLSLPLLVVGLVREPDVGFAPTLLLIKNSLVGFTTTHTVKLRNNENESLNFQFKGNSMCNESGKTVVVIVPEEGVLKPQSDTEITIKYTPIQDGPLSFKIFCSVKYLTHELTLCVNALSHLIKPTVTYRLINAYEHTLNSELDTNIHLDETASTYERSIPFLIKNDGSATFHYEWNYIVSPVRKYLTVIFEPRVGFLPPGHEIECMMSFTLKQVPVIGYPVTLTISDGPVYNIFLHAEIEKPAYHFSCREFDFGKCIVDAPDSTYKKTLGFRNDEKTLPLSLDLTSTHLPELFVEFDREAIRPGARLKIATSFRPKQIKQYEFKLQFWVNSLCEEIIIIRGEGVPLLLDLYEGCQKSFDLGPVKLGQKIVRVIEVMNHSKVPIDASFIFEEMYPKIKPAGESQATTSSMGSSICLDPNTSHVPDDPVSRVQHVAVYKATKQRDQIDEDIKNALASVKVVPTRCIIRPHMKVPLKIHFKPVGLISSLNVQLNAKVLDKIRPLVSLSGSATGMLLYFSQNSLQFGRVRKRGCKILKVMLINKGDFGARFWWQPLKSNEFEISPMLGHIDARTNVTFTITFRPQNHNPFIKVWASCNIENYKAQELALYATCVDFGVPQNQSLVMECPVRSVRTDYVVTTNPTDDSWLVLSEISGGPFETPKEFVIDAHTTYEIPIHFKPRTMGTHEAQVLYSPLGEGAIFLTLIGHAVQPNPNGELTISVPAKETHVQNLTVNNITERPETYIVVTEVEKIIPEKFEGYYEFHHPETFNVWGEATGNCWWKFVCYEPCEMQLKVMFINKETTEMQYYQITAQVTPSKLMGTLSFVARARDSVTQELLIVNPLDGEAEFFVKCEKLQLAETVTVNRHSQTKMTLTYSPLVVGTVEDYIEVSNKLLGTYEYKAILSCLPAKEKDFEFSAELGKRMPIRLRVVNKSDLKADFICNIDNPSIMPMEKNYSLGPGDKGKFLVDFEPIELGAQDCRVAFSSPVAGEFVFNIRGIGKTPKPQGPIEIRAGGTTNITFKNIFLDMHTFKISADNEEYFIKQPLVSINGKKEIKVPVYLEARESHSLPTASLTIENVDPPEPQVQWIYFLKGIP